MFLIIVVVCVIMLVEKCAKGGFEFYSVRGVAVIFECVPVFLLFPSKWHTTPTVKEVGPYVYR